MLYNPTQMWSWIREGVKVKDESFVLVAFTFLLILGFILFEKKQTKRKYRSLPGPRGLPLVGYLPFLGSDLRWTFKDLATIYGPIFKVRLGTTNCIVVTSPSHAKEILRDQDVIFANRTPSVAAIDNHFAVSLNTRKDILGYLLELTKLKDPAKSLSVPQVKAILMDAIIGGMDTTATTAEWVMAELLKHPKIMRIVQDELEETVGLNETVEEAHIPKLKYLNAVLKETLRLHPPVALLVPHRSSKTTTVGGYDVQKNSMVFINTWAMHRDPKLWDEPLEFRPERFLSSSENFDFAGNQYKYLPFGSGRRMCPGLNLAEKMSMSVLSSMLHCFQWKLPTGNVDFDLSERFGLVVKKSKPTMAIPSPRLSNMELYLDE